MAAGKRDSTNPKSGILFRNGIPLFYARERKGTATMSIKGQLRPAPKSGGKRGKQDTPPAEHDAEGGSHSIIHDALIDERGKMVRRARRKRGGVPVPAPERDLEEY
jgi:hypothetical protein